MRPYGYNGANNLQTAGGGYLVLRILYKMVSVVVCNMVFVRSGAPRSYPRAPSLALWAIHLAPLPGRQDSLASQAKILISGTITKTRSNAAQSLMQIWRIVLNGLAKTLVHAILTRNTKRKPRTYLSSVSKLFKPAEKKSRAFAQPSKIYFSRYTFAYCTPSSFARSWVLTAMSILLPLIAPPVSSAMNTP